ncbi:MAG: hypothetical protein JO057_13985 [Chloroflexi bacterium]|nr:hypothetical protein [Chloroflexota bacterium]
MHSLRSYISSKPRRSLPRLLGARNNFTPAEVRQRLKVDHADDPRTAAVHAAAERVGIWSSLLRQREALELGRAASRLPTVVFWYRQGVSACEIGRRLSPLGGAWDANRAVDTAAALIAQMLNRGDAPELAVS